MRQFLAKNIFFLFFIVINIVLISGCEKEYNNIIDSTGGAPAINDASCSISVVNTDTINIAGQPMRNPTDILTIRGTAKVRISSFGDIRENATVGYSLTNFQFSSYLTEGLLHDDGVFPDITANDSVYSGYIEFQIQRFVVGTFSLKLWSESAAGYKSNTLILPLEIIRLNRPPVISNLVAPDTVNLSEIASFSISLKVVDPDGFQDIKSVVRYTPSGKVLPLYPFNDSIYVETVSVINPPPSLGSYLFYFRAFDKSNDSSNVLTKTIVVVN